MVAKVELEGGGEQTTVGGAQFSAAVDAVVGSDPRASTDQNVTGSVEGAVAVAVPSGAISVVVCLQGSGAGTHNALDFG